MKILYILRGDNYKFRIQSEAISRSIERLINHEVSGDTRTKVAHNYSGIARDAAERLNKTPYNLVVVGNLDISPGEPFHPAQESENGLRIIRLARTRGVPVAFLSQDKGEVNLAREAGASIISAPGAEKIAESLVKLLDPTVT
jgi:hypothetical protein